MRETKKTQLKTKTPLDEIYEDINKTELRIIQLKMKLQKRWILKKLLFFIPLPKEVWGGQTYQTLRAEKGYLDFLKKLKDKPHVRDFMPGDGDPRVRKGIAIAKATVRAYGGRSSRPQRRKNRRHKSRKREK